MDSRSEVALVVLTLLGGLFGGASAIVARYLAGRSAEPSDAEVARLEVMASEAWESTASSGGPPGQVTAPLPAHAGDGEAERILKSYSKDLRAEAKRIAKRAGATEASPTHMRLAADRLGLLRSRTTAVADIGLSVGGIVFGAALSFEINLLTGGDAKAGWQPWVLVIGAAGFAMFIVSATVKCVKR